MTEAAQLVRPERHDLLVLRAGHAEELLDGRDDGKERLRAARKEIQGDDALVGPGVERHVTFQQDAHARHALGLEGVAVVAQQRQSAGLDDVDHGGREAILRIEKIVLDVLDVDEKVLALG
eukprot:CAMPEP_0197457700 /NCGR_PEP_ID=MMETSP1175-20131217/46772_1 /TAXON_ID=1003142 /ORGANISM="Triceratium dubium, Strain CCMP147" /LENGTH=120 /DNA_ID=CAMNT_0042992137 /DNA_START=141 /DNA_END=500 /DNA_ORIENTATION=-